MPGGQNHRRAQLGRYVNILHLADLHFEATDSTNETYGRKQVHVEMLKTLRRVVDEGRSAAVDERPLDDWRPDVIAISGDLAWRASKEDYDEAEQHLNELLNCVERDTGDVVMCPGNHDRNRGRDVGRSVPKDVEESDSWLSPDSFERGSDLVTPFDEYVVFCRRLGAMRPKGLQGVEDLTGMCRRELPERDCTVEFAVVNSAWFSGLPDSDVRQMWLGLELIRKLWLDAEDARTVAESHKIVRVGLCHHTREWLHEEEHDTYTLRVATYRFFARECHVLLHGHVEGGLEAPSRPYNTAQAFTGGASYAGGRYRNNFSLLQLNLDDQSIRRRGFEYDPREPAWFELDSARGTFDLGLEREEPAPADSVDDLNGAWRSVFWPEDLPSDRKPTWQVTLVRDAVGDHGGWFKTPDWDDSESREVRPEDVDDRLSMKGKLENGYFTGTWRDPYSVKPGGTGARFGAFQLKVIEDGAEMVGQWVGFNSDHKVLNGRWRFITCGDDGS